MRRIEAFEMRCYWRTKKISWTDRITNEEVLERVSESKSIWKSVLQKRRNELIGRTLRHDGLLLLILEGIIDGKNRRGRPRLQHISQIIEDQGYNSYEELKRNASKHGSCCKPIIRLNTAEEAPSRVLMKFDCRSTPVLFPRTIRVQ